MLLAVNSSSSLSSPSDLSPALIGRERGERGLLLILSRQKIFWYFMHMRGKTICEFSEAENTLGDRAGGWLGDGMGARVIIGITVSH